MIKQSRMIDSGFMKKRLQVETTLRFVLAKKYTVQQTIAIIVILYKLLPLLVLQ